MCPPHTHMHSTNLNSKRQREQEKISIDKRYEQKFENSKAVRREVTEPARSWCLGTGEYKRQPASQKLEAPGYV